MRDELQQLPGIGPSMAADLRRLGVRSVRELLEPSMALALRAHRWRFRNRSRDFCRATESGAAVRTGREETSERHPLRCAVRAPRGTRRDIRVPAFACAA